MAMEIDYEQRAEIYLDFISMIHINLCKETPSFRVEKNCSAFLLNIIFYKYTIFIKKFLIYCAFLH